LVLNGDTFVLRLPLMESGFVQEDYPDTMSEVPDQTNYVAEQWSAPFHRDFVIMLVSWQVGSINITFSHDIEEVMRS